MKHAVLILTLACCCASLPAQEQLSAILLLTGETDAESLDDTVLERFEAWEARPLDLNRSSRDRLAASGLLSPFQVASLWDYRSRHGDILSYTELGLLDGFGPDVAAALRPFTCLSASGPPGHGPVHTLRQRVQSQGSFASGRWQAGGKYRIWAGETVQAGLAFRRNTAATCQLSAFGQLRHRNWQLLVGDFHARFGQGLALWSGFTMAGLATPAGFARRPTGLSPTWSYGETSLRGVAAQAHPGPWRFSALLAMPGVRALQQITKTPEYHLLGAIHAEWAGRYGSLGVTALLEGGGKRQGKLSWDGRCCIRGVDLFAEAAWDFVHRSVAGVAGISWQREDWMLSGLIRHYPSAYSAAWSGAVRSASKASDEQGAALGLGWKRCTLTADYARRLSSGQRSWKITACGAWDLLPCLQWRIRLAGRLRNAAPRHRTDLRSDLLWSRDAWRANLRLNAVFSRRYGLLGYLEAGRQQEGFTLWLRGTLFRADHWDDRIYCYERDIPGLFHVPAYHGRGYSLSLTGSGSRGFARWRLKAAARTALTRSSGAAARGEFSLLLQADF